jgi:beta-glucuronidase
MSRIRASRVIRTIRVPATAVVVSIAAIAAIGTVGAVALPGVAQPQRPAVAAPAPAAATATNERVRVSLDGSWRFALDPTRTGEPDRWFATDLDESRWDSVDVPHCWPLDPRYTYTGTAWYRRTFDAPADLQGRHARLEFDAVFARARVWVNGQLVGSHEGGYTPFGFDVTPHLMAGRPNSIAVAADNSWSLTTIPGARPGADPTRRVYPWWDFGGIVRPVTLVLSAPIFITNQRIVATPDLASGRATIESTIWVRNTTSSSSSVRVYLALARLDSDGEGGSQGQREGQSQGRREEPLAVAQPRDVQATVEIPAGETKTVTLRTALPRERVRLWTLDKPVLHIARATLSTAAIASAATPATTSDTLASTFGIRRFEVKDAQLLLNGQPIRLGGGNRASDHPRFGLIEPRDVVETDLRLMKTAGMELQRMIHYALPTTLLDAADRLGVLIIAEAGNWQLQPTQMDDESMRADYRNQMREMVERDWNHPSVIAWSVGNEYPSDTPAGVRWTKDMAAFVRTLDTSRPITFASYRADKPEVKRPEDEGSHYVDFVSINLYGRPAAIGERLDVVHGRWPNKPVFISEFGVRADKVKDERERETWFHEAIGQLRTRPFVAGASVWTFNDYRSRFPDTNANGYRPWGLIDPDRQPRGAYRVVKEEFATLRLTSASLAQPAERASVAARVARVDLEARADFPSRVVTGMTLRLRRFPGDEAVVASTRIPDLAPGQRITLALDAAAAPATSARSAPAFTPRDARPRYVVDVVRPDGSIMCSLAVQSIEVGTTSTSREISQ